MLRMIATILLLGCSVWDCMAGEPDSLTKRGRILAKQMCAGCHAIGNSGQSPHVGAPAFRALDRRVDFDRFEERLRGGLMSGHPDMPTFRFTRADARAFIAYLRSIQAPEQ
jgi:cytochrome c